MYLVIAGTNRKQSATLRIAKHYHEELQEREEESHLFALEDLPLDFFFPQMYDQTNEALKNIQENWVIPAAKFIFVFPEYNGSFPGVLKAFIDACDVERAFHNKKAALVGISAGRGGNLRGMDHLTGVLHHLKVSVVPDPLPISSIFKLFDDEGNLVNDEARQRIRQQIDAFQTF